MNRRSKSTENELKYLEITDEILDGVFPEEEILKAKESNKENKFSLDIYGRPQLISNYEKSESEQSNIIPEQLKESGSDTYKKFHQATALLLRYANIHISVLFILILSFLSLVFTNIISAVTTVLIIFSLLALDHKYAWGLATGESQLG